MVVDREAASLDRVSEGLVVEQQNASYDVNNEEEGTNEKLCEEHDGGLLSGTQKSSVVSRSSMARIVEVLRSQSSPEVHTRPKNMRRKLSPFSSDQPPNQPPFPHHY